MLVENISDLAINKYLEQAFKMLISYSRFICYELKQTVWAIVFSVNNALDSFLGMPVCIAASDRKVIF